MQLQTTRLVNTFKRPLHPFHRERLEMMDRVDFAPIAEKARLELQRDGIDATDEILANGILALKHYYAVALLDPANLHAVSAPVDPFWHSHILFTKEYAEFCDTVMSKFLHHTPLDKRDVARVEEVSQLYSYTRTILQDLLHDFDEAWWPEARFEVIMCTHYEHRDPEVLSHALYPRLTVA